IACSASRLCGGVISPGGASGSGISYGASYNAPQLLSHVLRHRNGALAHAVHLSQPLPRLLDAGDRGFFLAVPAADVGGRRWECTFLGMFLQTFAGRVKRDISQYTLPRCGFVIICHESWVKVC